MPSNNQWFENDRFWEATQPFLFSERIRQMASVQTDHILKLLDLEPGAKILDLCCGPGRHALELAQRGYVVTGVDRNEMYLQQAKDQAVEKGMKVELVKEDMRHFVRPEAFDGAMNIFTSFGYFDNAEDEIAVLKNLHSSLKPNGRLVMEMVGKEIVARIYQPRDWGEKDGAFIITEHEPIDNWTYMKNRRILIEGGKREEFEFTIRLYSAYELISILKTAGFKEINIYGDLEGAPYDHEAKRLVALARK